MFSLIDCTGSPVGLPSFGVEGDLKWGHGSVLLGGGSDCFIWLAARLKNVQYPALCWYYGKDEDQSMSLTLSLNTGCQLGATRALRSESGDRMTTIIQSAWRRLASLVRIRTDGGLHTSTYDALNRTSVRLSPSGAPLTYLFDADSRQTTIVRGSGELIAQYDALSRAITQVQFDGATAIVTTIDTYDVAGRKTKQNKNGTVVTYTYDDINRLTGQLQSGARATFVMDAVGNIEVKHHEGSLPITMTYDAASRLTTMQDGPTRVTFTYDDNGSMTQESRGAFANSNFTYDRENRMRTEHQIGLVANPTTMQYDGDGLRRTKTQGSSVTTYVWDGSDYLGEVNS